MKIGKYEVASHQPTDERDLWVNDLVIVTAGDRLYIGLLDEEPEDDESELVLQGMMRVIEDAVPQVGQQGVMGWIPLSTILALHGHFVAAAKMHYSVIYYVKDLHPKAAEAMINGYSKMIDPPRIQAANSKE